MRILAIVMLLAVGACAQQPQTRAAAPPPSPGDDAAIIGAFINRPQPQPVQAPVFTAPRTLNCWRLGNNVQCY
jgi:hypothetical protein